MPRKAEINQLVAVLDQGCLFCRLQAVNHQVHLLLGRLLQRRDGIFEADPVTNPKAKMFSELPFLSILNKSLKVMDSTAITLCMDNKLPLIVFNLKERGNLKRIMQGDKIGTLVTATNL